MSDSRVAVGLDRLPWLPDEPARKREPSGNLAGWVVAAILAVAGGSYWLGLQSSDEAPPAPRAALAPPEATVRLPAPAPSPEVAPVPAPKIEPMAAPAIPVPEAGPAPRPRSAPVERSPAKPQPDAAAGDDEPDETTAKSETQAPPAAAPQPARPAYTGPWPVRVVEGASGRLVRVGTFRTVRQAKKGWWAIVKMNPALKPLPALVVPVASLRDGGVYYRLQMGTTSQAHSYVLCQRMRMIGQSCVVIDERRSAR